MSQFRMPEDASRGVTSPSFLLAQLGSFAAARFAKLLEPLGFAPHHAGILRILAQRPGLSQQDLAKMLKMHASRLVGVLDELQQKGLVQRRPSAEDRRLYALHMSSEGEIALRKIGKVAGEHNKALMEGLSSEQQRQLGELLGILADKQGLTRGVHPGYARFDEVTSHRKPPSR